MKLLLDTHIVFWWQVEADRISPITRKLVQEADQVLVSRVSQWELAIKANIGKLNIDLPRFTRQVEVIGFSWLPIESAHILIVANLPRFDDHKDPFDRLLIAQSLSEPLILLTADTKLARYGTTVRIV